MSQYDISCECTVIGCGFIGLACTAEASKQGIETVAFESKEYISSVMQAVSWDWNSKICVIQL